MTETPPFRVVLRGYEPAQVDKRLQELAQQADQARQQAAQLAERVQQLEQHRVSEGDGESQPVLATFEHLGQRISKILSLAEAEAKDLLDKGRAALESERSAVAEEVSRQRSDADRHAEQRRTDADTEASRALEHARKTADDRLDAAERDAAARLQEAEAVYEHQRAKAAQAAADFETTLARRRAAAEEDFTTQVQDHQSRLAEIESHIDLTRTNAEKMNDAAVRESRRLVEEAEKQAASIVGEARAQAARVRADSDRELSAATQRRDSINAQLTNVRQMLATLTGGAMVPMVDPFEAPAGEAAPEAEADHDTDSDAGAEAPVEAETDEVVEAEDGAEDDRQG
jgi:cell division septum initiation protein DivIVA